ncbi:MAG TPA: ATP-binding protein [Nitrososphaeraceae archaeon]|nr:ATP-binding protein [Nitrososphaeraceae archaeon]
MLTNEILNKLENIATVEEINIKNVVEDTREKIKLISTRLQLKIDLDKYNNNIDRKESLLFLNKTINTIKSAINNFEEISLYDLTGTVVASTNNSLVGKNYANDKFFIQGKSQNELSFLYRDTNNEIKSHLTGPLVLDGKLIGVATAIYNLENLLSIFQTYVGLGKTGELTLVKRDDNGDALFITPSRFNSGAFLNLKVSKNETNTPVIQSLLKEEKTFTDTIDYRGIPVLAVTRYLEGVDLGLISKIDKVEAFAPLEKLEYLTVISGILVSVLAIIVSLIIGKSISNPIQKLNNASKDISQGKFDNPIRITKGSDEIKELSKQLDKMRQNIHYINNNLNEVVNERTQKLEKTIAELKEKEEVVKTINKQLVSANNELNIHDNMQKEFINVAAHELRTPIMPILGLSELLYNKIVKGNNLKQETLKEHLQIIVRNSYRLHKLVEAVLDVTKLESRIFKLNTELVELNEVIANVVIDFENLIKNKKYDDGKNKNNVKIIYEPNRNNKILVNADRTRLTQVISNLLDNALKFTQGGFIIITTRITHKEKDNNDKVIVMIKDSGIGIDNEILPRLFTKFATKSDQGTGLGLFIVKKIIEAHGGMTKAENNSNGIGSTFYFTLPIVKTSEIVINEN